MASTEVMLTRNHAAHQLNQNGLSNVKIMGSWSHAVGTIIARNGWDISNLSEYFIDISYPNDQDLASTGEDSLLILYFNRDNFSARMSQILFPENTNNTYNPIDDIKTGTIVKQHQNEKFLVYLWTKNGFNHSHGH